LTVGEKLAFYHIAADSLTFSSIYAALGIGHWYTAKYLAVDKISIIKIIENHAFAAAFTTAIWLATSHFVLVRIFQFGEEYVNFLEASLVWRSVLGVLYYLITISFYHLQIMSEKLRDHTLNQAELQTLLKEAELRSLKFQVNPHFIFNSLNSINSLTITDPPKAGEMTIKLGNFLRYTLSKGEEKTSLLKEELASMKLYLEIERVRFGDRIEYEEKCDKTLDNLEVPSMILQPLFENAIKHGVYESISKIPICLNCASNGRFAKISLHNRFEEDSTSSQGEGIGLKNVRARLERMYNHTNLMDVEKSENDFTVTLFVPIQEVN